MKISLLIFFISFLFNQNLICQEGLHLKDFKLSGKVKSVRVYDYDAKDKFGVITKQIKVDSGSYVQNVLTVFNKEGSIESVIQFNQHRIEQGKEVYRYNDLGLVIEINFYRDKSLFKKKLIKHNEFGKPEELNWYDKNGDLKYKYVYTYDMNGNLKEYLKYEPGLYIGLNLLYKHTFKYNEKNELIETIDFEGYDKIYNKKYYTYDNQGLLIKEKSYSSFTPEGKLRVYEYNMNKHKIKDYILEDNEKALNISTYSYIYDDKGNWVEKTFLKDGIPFFIQVRELVYFE